MSAYYHSVLLVASSPVVGAGSAARHWQLERVVAVGLLGAVPAGFFFPGAVVDYTLAVLIPLHGHWWVSQQLAPLTVTLVGVSAASSPHCDTGGCLSS